MTRAQLVGRRLHHQCIAGTSFTRPVEVVRWLGAIQAQDYLGSLWAIGLRMQHPTERAIEEAIVDRSIVRTWPMRGTLHFVAATDVGWLLSLLAPRAIARSRSRFRQLDLSEAVLAHSRRLLEAALSGGKRLARNAAYQLLETGGIATRDSRGLHILGRLAQVGVICFGPRDGKQPTFVLLSEWAPQAKTMKRDEALAELAKRYFSSRGPATPQDFAWWSGLTLTDANAGIAMAGSDLRQEIVGGRNFWLSPSPPRVAKPAACLLPCYDEFTVSYQDRSDVLDPLHAKRTGHGIFVPTMVLNGQVVGSWKRTLHQQSVVIQPNFFTIPVKEEKQAFMEAAMRYGSFLRRPAVLASRPPGKG